MVCRLGIVEHLVGSWNSDSPRWASGFARPRQIAATVTSAAVSKKSLIDAPRSLSIISLFPVLKPRRAARWSDRLRGHRWFPPESQAKRLGRYRAAGYFSGSRPSPRIDKSAQPTHTGPPPGTGLGRAIPHPPTTEMTPKSYRGVHHPSPVPEASREPIMVSQSSSNGPRPVTSRRLDGVG